MVVPGGEVVVGEEGGQGLCGGEGRWGCGGEGREEGVRSIAVWTRGVAVERGDDVVERGGRETQPLFHDVDETRKIYWTLSWF